MVSALHVKHHHVDMLPECRAGSSDLQEVKAVARIQLSIEIKERQVNKRSPAHLQ